MRIISVILAITSTNLLTAATFEELFRKGNDLFYKQQFAESLALYKEARTIDDSQAAIHYNIGVTYYELRDFVAAEASLKKALMKNPKHARAALYMGKIARERGQMAQAEQWFKQALSYDPGLSDAAILLADMLKEKLACEDALIYLKAAYERNTHDINLAFNLANTLNMADHVQEALDLYLMLLEKLPHDSSINYNIAYTYKKLGYLEKALPYYEKTLSLKSNHTEARFSRGLAYLMLGDWERGWDGYEYRWDRGDQQKSRNYPEPRWQGEPLAGKHIFVYAEQGLGDTFQFVRYLKMLKEQGAYITLAPQNPLRALLTLCPYIDNIISFHECPASFDYWIPLVSLPYVLKTRIDTVPHEIPYLFADPALETYWRKYLASDPNFKIGICWQGNSEYNTAFLRAAVKSKSAPAQLFEPLTQIPGVSVYSLQRITGVDQVAHIPPTMNLITFDAQFDMAHGRFMDTAAVMKNLDLVITIDTSICHLAAALGVPVWNLLPTPADWRWMLDRSDTPWYPNMRLFRQPTQGDWHGLMDEVVLALQTLLADQEMRQTTIPASDRLANIIEKLSADCDAIENQTTRALLEDIVMKLEMTHIMLTSE